MPSHGSHVPLLKFQMPPNLDTQHSLESKRNEHIYVRLSEAKASHSHRRGLRFLHLLHISYIRDLWSVPLSKYTFSGCSLIRKPITTLDCVLLEDNSLAFTVALRIEIGLRTCLWVLIRPSFRSLLIHLLTAIGLTPSGSSAVHIYTQTVHRTTQLTTVVT
jgi:hypothetical protein